MEILIHWVTYMCASLERVLPYTFPGKRAGRAADIKKSITLCKASLSCEVSIVQILLGEEVRRRVAWRTKHFPRMPDKGPIDQGHDPDPAPT